MLLKNVERRHVKFILATAGLAGIYAGAFAGMGMLSLRGGAASPLAELLILSVLGLCAGFAVLIPIDKALGEKASHVDLLKVPRYWIVAGVALYAGNWLLEKITPWALPPFVSNLALWLAAFLAVWVDEPKPSSAGPALAPAEGRGEPKA